MSPDHLCKEGLAYREEIEIPFNIVFSFSIILILLYGIHLNGHFYLFGLITRIFLWIYNLLSRLHHMLFYWYFILCFNHHAGQKKTALDSTECRDCVADQQILPVTSAPSIDAFLTVRPQITFFQQHHFDEIQGMAQCLDMYLSKYPTRYINCITSHSEFIAFINHAIQLALDLTTYLNIWALLLILLETQDVNASYVQMMHDYYNHCYDTRTEEYMVMIEKVPEQSKNNMYNNTLD